LVSASALKSEGQLIVLNNPPKLPGDLSGGPCYRCVFPKPPPAESVLSCGEGGILGPVVGVMGVLQALEALKLITSGFEQGHHADRDVADATTESAKPTLLMFSAHSTPQFRSVRLRSRRKDCAVCSNQATITAQSLTSGSLDYVAFCGVQSPINLLSPHDRISAAEYSTLMNDGSRLLIDVRDTTQFQICSLEGAVSVPWSGSAATWLAKAEADGLLEEDGRERYVVCRFGNDSQLAAKAIMDKMGVSVKVRDIQGGYQAWRAEVNNEFPDY